MMNTDENLQQSMENGAVPDLPDATAYKRVFDALRKSREYTLPSTFEDSVLQKITTRQSSLFAEHAVLIVGVLFICTGLIIACAYARLDITMGLFKKIVEFRGLIVLAAALIVAFNILEKKLLHLTRS